MKFLHILSSSLVVVSLTACSSGSGNRDNGDLIGANATLAEAETAFDELENRVTAISVLDGDTLEANLPTTSASYQGVVSGGSGTGGSGTVDHYGDLSLSTNFATNDVTGSIYNVVTDVPNFENPTGNIDVVGDVSSDGGVANIVISGSGSLVGNGVEADFVLLNSTGTFVGTDGAGIEGNQATNIDWTIGPDAANPIEFSDGAWNAERN